MDVACPQCGNPRMEVDAANNVVYCPKCGFAVSVDPQTGNVTPISQGGGAQQQSAAAPMQSHGREILGTEPLTFFMFGTAIFLFLALVWSLDVLILGIAELILFFLYWTHR